MGFSRNRSPSDLSIMLQLKQSIVLVPKNGTPNVLKPSQSLLLSLCASVSWTGSANGPSARTNYGRGNWHKLRGHV